MRKAKYAQSSLFYGLDIKAEKVYAMNRPAVGTLGPHLSTFLTLFLLIVLTALHCPVSLQLCRMQRRHSEDWPWPCIDTSAQIRRSPHPRPWQRPHRGKTQEESKSSRRAMFTGAQYLLAYVKHRETLSPKPLNPKP